MRESRRGFPWGAVAKDGGVQGQEQNSPPKARPLGRIVDAIAVLLIVAAVWKFFIDPRFIAPRVAVVPAPNVTLNLMDGGSIDLAATHGKVVFLDFWASWCEPCKASIPLIEHYKAAHPQALVFSVDGGESNTIAERYARAAKMRSVVLDPSMTVADAFHVNVFPTMIVIGRDGKLHGKWVGFHADIQQRMATAAKEF